MCFSLKVWKHKSKFWNLYMTAITQDAINDLFNRLLLTDSNNSVTVATIHPAYVVGKMLHKKFEHSYALPDNEKLALREKSIRYKVDKSTLTMWLVRMDEL
jgi:hypothetical protein